MKAFWVYSGLFVVLVGIDLIVTVEASIAQIENDSLESDWDTLKKIYRMTGGPNWTNNTNWDITSEQPPNAEALGQWYGVTVFKGRVTQIELENNNLRGAIPWAIGNLSRLQILDLSNNRVQGPILPEIGKLSELQQLNLASNQLSGEIPSEIGNLYQLSYLNLRSNQLEGRLPESIGNLQGLLSLYLNDNQLSGEIPIEWGRLSNLRSLWVAYNPSLKGPLPYKMMDQTRSDLTIGVEKTNVCVPPESNVPEFSYREGYACLMESEWNALVNLYQATDGHDWRVSTNWDIETRSFIGAVDKWFGIEIVNGRIHGLQLPYNNLRGTLPSELSALTELRTLNLKFNPLTGSIPPALIAVETLQELSLDGTEICLPPRSSLQDWVNTMEIVSDMTSCTSSDGDRDTTFRSSWTEMNLWIAILLILFVVSVLIYGILRYLRHREANNAAKLDAQSVKKSLDTLKRETTDMAQLIRKNIDANKEMSEYSNSLLSMQRTLSEREVENERLKRGYDNTIFRKFLTPFIRLDQTIAYLLRQNSPSPSTLETIHRLLKDALADCNVESFTPEIGSDYRQAFGVTDRPKISQTEIQEDDYKIAEVLECGYLIRGDGKNEVLIPAHVIVHRFKTNI